LVLEEQEKHRTTATVFSNLEHLIMNYRLYVFGSNGEGQLGIPAADIVNTPTATILDLYRELEGGIKGVHGGDNHSLILGNGGQTWSSGDNRKGQIGLPHTRRSRLESFKTQYIHISFCAATCESSAYIENPKYQSMSTILTTDGASHWGELGLGPTITQTNANDGSRRQSLPHPVIDFAAGAWHYVAILANGAVYGWGKSRLDQLGQKLSVQQRITTPTHIEEQIAFKPWKVVCGKDFTYLAGDPSAGEHILFGRDKFGIRSNMPHRVQGWQDIGATWHAIFVLFQDGSLTAWGKNDMWQLVPEGLPPIDKIAVGSEHVLALTREGKLISWGWGKHGNCGDLTALEREGKVKNDMVSGCWNEIPIPERIRSIGAGFCTSFVFTGVVNDQT
jgi:protein ATS1